MKHCLIWVRCVSDILKANRYILLCSGMALNNLSFELKIWGIWSHFFLICSRRNKMGEMGGFRRKGLGTLSCRQLTFYIGASCCLWLIIVREAFFSSLFNWFCLCICVLPSDYDCLDWHASCLSLYIMVGYLPYECFICYNMQLIGL